MSNSLSLFCILATTVIWVIVGVFYHKRQNNSSKIGGRISVPKSVWLNFTIYVYCIFPVVFSLVYHPESPWGYLLAAIILVFLIRAIVQSLMMYEFKNWRTKHGVRFNVVAIVIILAVFLGFLLNGENLFGLNPKDAIAWFYVLYAGIVVATYAVDTFYAIEFNKLVGEKTKGDDAIWFASNDPKYDRINAITKRNNYIFITAILLVLCLYTMHYDQF